jgi:zinc/manganese transport system substrate-binding protein
MPSAIRTAFVLLLLPAAVALAGCASATGSAGGRLQVVAAENFWGSLAAQLAGDRATVTSILTNPDTDPHSYDPTPSDARELAEARMAILNGAGYDPWASQLLAANPVSGRATLDVGSLLGLHDGDNPHQWYSPAVVTRVIDAIAADYERLDPTDRAYFAARRAGLLRGGLAGYQRLIAEIRQRYTGVPVGYSESIFQPLGTALGLRLLTPYSFAKAIAEGTDVSAADKQTVDAQATGRQIAVWVFNSQNVTPDVQRVSALAAAAHIPIVTITETLDPAGDSFQRWQSDQLARLAAALHEATRR